MSAVQKDKEARAEEGKIEMIEEDFKYSPLDVLSIVKNSQSQNGLKHSDYKRYRHYCTKRLRRIRKAVKMTHGRGKFVARPLTEENITEIKDSRALHLCLYNAERAWAYAMSLRQEFSTNKNANPRMKFQIRRKFLKALQWAKLLKGVTKKYTDDKSALEAEAYSEYMSGVYHFEIEQWETSLNSFLRCRTIYEELSKVADSLQKILYKEKIEQIEQSIRYCNHKLNKGKDSLDKFVEDKRLTNDPTLSTRIEGLLNTQREKNLSGHAEISYHGMKLPIKNEKTLITLQNLEEVQQVLSKLNKTEMVDESEESNKLNTYIEIFSLYDELIRLANKEKEENKNVEATLQIYIKLANYFQSKKLESVIERNRILISNARNRFNTDIGFDNVWYCKKNIKTKTSFPQDIVKLYDNLLQIYKQYLDIENSNPDFKAIKKIEIEETYYRALRCFYVACTHFSYGKLLEGYSLLSQFDNICQNAENISSKENLPLEQINPQLYADILSHKEKVSSLRVRAHVNILNQRNKEEEGLKKQMNDMAIEGDKKKKITLLSMLKNQIITEDDKSTENLEDVPLIDFPPSYSMLPGKPIFLDLGYSHLRYPSLKDRVKEEGKGVLGKVWGFFKK